LSVLAVKLDAGPDADPREVDYMAQVLRSELLRLDVEAVELSGEETEPSPEAVPGFGLAGVGEVTIRLVDAGALKSAVELVKAWTRRDAVRRAKLDVAGDSLELSAAAAAERQALVDGWIERVSPRLGPG
jgi:hypothetical protein